MTNNKPLISIVMSTYNSENTIEKSINSILQQTYSDFELIVINDGSTDKTGDIVKQIGDKRICLITQDNRGLAASLNRAISLVRGKYVARMDDDDIALPERLQCQIDYMLANSEIDIVGGQAWIIDQNDCIIGEMKKPLGKDNIKKYIEYACPIIHPTYLVKAEVYKAVGGYREYIGNAEDYDFLLRVVDSGYLLANVIKKVILYRVYPSDSARKNFSKNSMVQMVNTRKILKLHKFRKKGLLEPKHIVDSIKNTSVKRNLWFEFWHDLRNYFIAQSKGESIMKNNVSRIMVVLCSIMHYELLLSGRRGYRSLKWMDH